LAATHIKKVTQDLNLHGTAGGGVALFGTLEDIVLDILGLDIGGGIFDPDGPQEGGKVPGDLFVPDKGFLGSAKQLGLKPARDEFGERGEGRLGKGLAVDAHDFLRKLVGVDLALNFLKMGVGNFSGSFLGFLGHADRFGVVAGLGGNFARDLALLAVRRAVAKHPEWRARMFSN